MTNTYLEFAAATIVGSFAGALLFARFGRRGIPLLYRLAASAAGAFVGTFAAMLILPSLALVDILYARLAVESFLAIVCAFAFQRMASKSLERFWSQSSS